MFSFFKDRNNNVYQQQWERWKIGSYRISLRLNWEFLNFDREILSNTVAIEVKDYHGHFLENYTTTPYVHEEDIWTVRGLFEQVDFYPTIEFDKVYGFPKKLGNGGHWIVEVLKFEVLEYEEEETLADKFEGLTYYWSWLYYETSKNLRWYLISKQYWLRGKRQTITLKDFLMTGSFGGIRLGISQSEVIEILGGSRSNSEKSNIWGVHSLEVGFDERSDRCKVDFVKYNCNKFYHDKSFPPTIHIKGFIPIFEDTTLDEFIFYLESENMPYKIIWEELMKVRFSTVHINDATIANFAEDTQAIMGIYPKRM